jgi:hypothetical protein
MATKWHKYRSDESPFRVDLMMWEPLCERPPLLDGSLPPLKFRSLKGMNEDLDDFGNGVGGGDVKYSPQRIRGQAFNGCWSFRYSFAFSPPFACWHYASAW